MASKRDNILTRIMAEVAEEGEITFLATRLYCENRISYKAFMEAANRGRRIHEKRKAKDGPK